MMLALAILEALVKLAPLVAPIVEAAIRQGIDPQTIDWTTLYGRSLAELRAQVEAPHEAAKE